MAIAAGRFSEPAVKPDPPERNPEVSVAVTPRASSFVTVLLPEFGSQTSPELSTAMPEGVLRPAPV
jgi:hypothetical protein